MVLAGQATGWTAMAQAVRNFDEEKVRDCKEDVDTLLVFVCEFMALDSHAHVLTGEQCLLVRLVFSLQC